MSEATAGQEYKTDPFSGAQNMATWYEQYLFGLTNEIGEVPPLAEERCAALLDAEVTTEEDLAIITQTLWKVVGEAQSDVAYYICGYPDDAMDFFGSPNWQENVRAFRQKFAETESEAIANVVKLAPRLTKKSTKSALGSATTDATVSPLRKKRGQPADYVPSTNGVESYEVYTPEAEDVDETSEITANVAVDEDLELLTDRQLEEIIIDLDKNPRVSTDHTRMWLDKAGKRPLLSAIEEVELATRIEAGLFAKERLDNAEATGEALPLQLRRDLRWIVRDGEAAKNHFFEANLRLVISIAKKYPARTMSFLDLVQEGNLGMLHALEMFDYTKGFKFSTYATNWIKQAITRAMANQDRAIRVPVHMIEKINKLHRFKREMIWELGREPNAEELAAKMDLPVDKTIEMLQYGRDPVSLNMKVGKEGDTEFGELIGDEKADVAEDVVALRALQDGVRSVLDTLEARERGVMELRFGLRGNGPHTLDDIGRIYHLSKERVRQIESKTKSKLAHPARGLNKYLDLLNL